MLENELTFAKGLAREAGQEILRLARYGAIIEYKDDGEMVTSIDRAIDALIAEEITRRYPSDGLLTEESVDNERRRTKERVWIIDPVDGTEELKEYFKSPSDYPNFAVHIGLAIHGTATLGVVDAPVLHETYFGVKGRGSFIENKYGRSRLNISKKAAVEKATIGICSPKKTKNLATARAIGFENIQYIQSLGIKACYIAAGNLDAYLTVSNGGTKEWDTCAPSVIVEEAGGNVTDCYGNPFTYNKPDVHNKEGVVITNGFIHHDVIQRMPKR